MMRDGARQRVQFVRTTVARAAEGVTAAARLIRYARDPLEFYGRAMRVNRSAVLTIGARRYAMFAGVAEITTVLREHENVLGCGRALDDVRDVIGGGLLHAEGEAHRTQRRALQPLFSRARIHAHEPRFCETIDRAIAQVVQRASSDVFDLDGLSAALVVQLVTPFLFGTPLPRTLDLVAAERLAKAAHTLAMVRRVSIVGRRVGVSPLPKELRAARGTMRAALAALTNATREEAGAFEQMEREGLTPGLRARGAFTPFEQRCASLMVTGYDTLAAGVAWLWRYLLDDASRMVALEDEWRSYVAATPSAEERASAPLPRTTAFFREVLRLRPPVWSVMREVKEATEICGHGLRAGDQVALLLYEAGRDPAAYHDPEAVKPCRFAAREERAAEDREAELIAFGSGYRRCLGESLALHLGPRIVARLASALRFVPVEPVSLAPVTRFTLRPATSLQVRAEARHLA